MHHRHALHDIAVDEPLHDHVAGDEDREHRGEHTDRERDAEALDGASAEPDHDGADGELGDVGVDDRHERLVVASDERGLERLADVQLLAHALEDEDVGIDRHADGEHHAGEAGERHRRAEAGHDAEDNEQVDRERRDGDDAADAIVSDHEARDEGGADDGGLDAAADRVGGERGADFILLLDLEREVERVVQDVGKVNRLTLRERAGDFGGVAVDLLAHRRSGVEFAVEHDGEAAEAARALPLVGDGLGDLRELTAAFLGEAEDDLVAAELIDDRIRIGNAFAGHLGDALDVEILAERLAVAIFHFKGHRLVAGRHFHRRTGGGADHLEIEAGGLLEAVDDLGVVLGGNAGELDLDAILADRADDRLGDAKGIHAIADDLDRLGELFRAGLPTVLGHRIGVDLEGERDAAFEIEAELEAALGAAEEFVEEDVVALLDVLERRLEADLREVDREVEFLFATDLLEGDVDAGGLAGLHAGIDLGEELAEVGRLGGGFLFNVGAEGLVLQRHEGEHGPQRDGGGQDQFPEIATEHGWLLLNSKSLSAAVPRGRTRHSAQEPDLLTTTLMKALPTSTFWFSPMRMMKRSSFTLVIVP